MKSLSESGKKNLIKSFTEISAVKVFFVVCFVYFLILVGQPFQFPGDDFNILERASETSWKELFRGFFQFTPAYVHGEESVLTTRVFQTLIYKTFYSLFGVSTVPFTFLKCLCLGWVCAFAYLVSNHWVAPLMIATFPGTMISVMWISDFEIVSLALVCGAVYILCDT